MLYVQNLRRGTCDKSSEPLRMRCRLLQDYALAPHGDLLRRVSYARIAWQEEVTRIFRHRR